MFKLYFLSWLFWNGRTPRIVANKSEFCLRPAIERLNCRNPHTLLDLALEFQPFYTTFQLRVSGCPCRPWYWVSVFSTAVTNFVQRLRTCWSSDLGANIFRRQCVPAHQDFRVCWPHAQRRRILETVKSPSTKNRFFDSILLTTSFLLGFSK